MSSACARMHGKLARVLDNVGCMADVDITSTVPLLESSFQ